MVERASISRMTLNRMEKGDQDARLYFSCINRRTCHFVPPQPPVVPCGGGRGDGSPAAAPRSMPLEKVGADGYTGVVISSEDRYMPILVTGAAGFIGYHVCEALLGRGERVVGVDNLNDYYDPALKQARLERLRGRNGFSFRKLDIPTARLCSSWSMGSPKSAGPCIWRPRPGCAIRSRIPMSTSTPT